MRLSSQKHAAPVIHCKYKQLLWRACWERHPSLRCPSTPLSSALSPSMHHHPMAIVPVHSQTIGSCTPCCCPAERVRDPLQRGPLWCLGLCFPLACRLQLLDLSFNAGLG